jgi:hypothetical protein
MVYFNPNMCKFGFAYPACYANQHPSTYPYLKKSDSFIIHGPSTHPHQPKPIQTNSDLYSKSIANQELPTHLSTFSHQPKPIQTDPSIISTTTACQDLLTDTSTYPHQPNPIHTGLSLFSTTIAHPDKPTHPSTYPH